MTIANRDAISSPATGLLVFCTDNNAYYTNEGTLASPNWIMVSSQWTSGSSLIYYNFAQVTGFFLLISDRKTPPMTINIPMIF